MKDLSLVRRMLHAANALIERRAEIVPALAEATALSPEGVEHALLHHLERDATDQELERLATFAGNATVVLVVLSANVFVGALRAIALARLTAPRVIVRPSRREPVFAKLLVEAIGDPAIAIDESFEPAMLEAGEIHVYGRDETIADVRKKARPGVVVRGHGSGMGIAFVKSPEEASGLALDVVAFDQRGCLSPRIALVHGDDATATSFANALHDALSRLEETVPRGVVPSDERAAIARYTTTLTYAGEVRTGSTHVLGIAPAGAPLALPPPYRTLHLAAVADAERARRLLEPFARGIVTVSASTLEAAKEIAPIHARISLTGRMQRPRLDGPVDLRESM